MSKATVDQRFWAKVEKTDECWNWTAAKSARGYAVFWTGDKLVLSHRRSFEEVNGPIPEGAQVDHTCHNRLCVNPRHLRLASNKQNQENRRGAQANNPTGVRGVSWEKGRRKYRAVVRHNGRMYNLGRFDSVVEAEAVVIAKRLELYTHNDVDRRAA